MTDDQRKKYEEAAKAYTDNLGDDPPDHRDLRTAFKAGAEFATQDTEERVKQAYNEAIDKALAIVNDAYAFDSEDKIFAIEGQIQKLKL